MVVDSFSFTYAGATAPSLRDVSLRIGHGEFVVLAGANNAGKSTLCHALAGVIPHLLSGTVQGSVHICGNDAGALRVAELAKHLTLVMQKPEQQLSGVRFTVREEVAFALENRGVERAEMLQRVDAALCQTGLEALADHSPHHLSGGQLQRVMLAAAVAGNSPVLVLDEPTTFLDPAGEQEVLYLLRRLCDEGRTVILAGQRPDAMTAQADRIVVLHEGTVAMDGPPRQVLTSPHLREAGLNWSRYTRIAGLAHSHGLWRTGCTPAETDEQPLPVCLEETLEGLQHFANRRNEVCQPAHSVTAEETDMDARQDSAPIFEPSSEPRSEAATRRDAQIAAGITVGVATGPDAETSSANIKGIVLNGVCFEYGNGPQVLTDITLRIGGATQNGQGETIALLGHNGSGKSTLVRHFNGLLKPCKGTVQVNGLSTATQRIAQLAGHVALLFQNPDDQICKGTVLDEVALGPRNLGFAEDRVSELTRSALAAMDLAGRERSNPYDLGLSERKRLAIASILAMDTDIVVLDEPTAGLDPREIALLETAMRQLTTCGKSVVVISHDMDFVAENLSRAICLEAGHIRYQGPVSGLFADTPLLEQCGLLPPQTVRVATGCGMHLHTITPEGLVQRLLTESAKTPPR
ncbi:ABC transporter ATP-binding protein [Desulfovibrio subterraneus]|uniref:ABC transporter ATP-binding protein n=1 Tax=Desulfovibrio subterraneus TaxID=2718620 RepID=A0A7J0BNU9_9BACT|nr:ABC transporter ATP-binding protein [Desulfovibrio subterraneus]